MPVSNLPLLRKPSRIVNVTDTDQYAVFAMILIKHSCREVRDLWVSVIAPANEQLWIFFCKDFPSFIFTLTLTS